MIPIYADLIRLNLKTIKQVPVSLREGVQAYLDANA